MGFGAIGVGPSGFFLVGALYTDHHSMEYRGERDHHYYTIT